MLILQLTKIKFRQSLAREKVGDVISMYLSWFDIINILSYREKFKIENKKEIIEAWKFLYGNGISDSVEETIEQISKKEIKDFEADELEKFKTNEEIKMERFNKKFKNIYSEKDEVIEAKKILHNFIEKYRPILYNYLNKEIIEEQTIAPRSIRGDIAYLY